eukprot:m.15775 g.15775  ORF g.15775 m.15775 type:complete len:92 (-) comp5086_c0_seq1:106-381(-)
MVFRRVASFLANEVIVKALAKSPNFQKFAAATHQRVQHVSKAGAEAAENVKVGELTESMTQRASQATKFSKAFVSSLSKEFQKEMAKAPKK